VRRLLIHLHEARTFTVGFVEDFYALLELKERSGVNLSQLALGWAESAQESEFWVFFEKVGWAAAEEFAVDVYLLVDF
jgi:hypothetical protein